MQQSFYNAASGLKTQQFGVDAWANNISNINTVAYKAKTPQFSTLYADYLSAVNANSAGVSTRGYGVTVSSNTSDFSAGTTASTNNPYDLAIGNNGFFVLKQGDKISYTRDGSFHVDASGFLVNNHGKLVQGASLDKFKEGVFVDSSENDAKLSTQKVSDLSPIQIPKFTELKPEPTTDVSVSIELNTSSNSLPIENSYNHIIEKYGGKQYSAFTEKMDVFFDLKNGDILSMAVDGKAPTTYTYGSDFDSISTLQAKISSSNDSIKLNYENGKLWLKNSASREASLDFSGSTPSVLSALGIPDTKRLNEKESLDLNKITTKDILNIDFNALGDGHGGNMDIAQGDSITATIEGVSHTLYYGKPNEVVADGKVQGEDSTFMTIGDFINKLKAKTGLATALRNSQIHFKSHHDPAVMITSNKPQLLVSLGLPSDGQNVKSGIGALGDPLEIASFANSIQVFDSKSKKYHIQTKYILKNRENKETNQYETWDTVSFLLDNDGKSVSAKTYGALLSFEKEGAPPTLYSKDNNEKIDNLKIDFFDNNPINYDFSNLDSEIITRPNASGNTRILDTQANGRQGGAFNNIFIDAQGIIRASFTNSQELTIGRIGLVDFANPQGLKSVGGNEYEITYSRTRGDTQIRASGDPVILWDEDGNLSTEISSGRLENSNVNLSEGLTSLIVLQRAFGANSKAVTTSDEMEQEAINLKR